MPPKSPARKKQKTGKSKALHQLPSSSSDAGTEDNVAEKEKTEKSWLQKELDKLSPDTDDVDMEVKQGVTEKDKAQKASTRDAPITISSSPPSAAKDVAKETKQPAPKRRTWISPNDEDNAPNTPDGTSEKTDAQAKHTSTYKPRIVTYLDRLRQTLDEVRHLRQHGESISELLSNRLVDLVKPKAGPWRPDTWSTRVAWSRGNNKKTGYQNSFTIRRSDTKQHSSFSLLDKHYPSIDFDDLNIRKQIVDCTTNMLNSWPTGPMSIEADRILKRIMVQIVISHISPPSGPIYYAPIWRKQQGVCLNVHFVDEVTGEAGRFRVEDGQGMVKVYVPPIPPNTYLLQNVQEIIQLPKTASGEYQSVIPPLNNFKPPDNAGKGTHTHEMYCNAETFYTYLGSKLVGLVTTKPKIYRLRSHFQRLYADRGRSLPGDYLFSVRHNGTNGLSVGWLRTSRKELGFGAEDTFRMTVRSCDVRWVLHALETAERVYVESHDTEASSLTLAEAIDGANVSILDGENPPFDCVCEDRSISRVLHPCCYCGHKTPCCERERNYAGLWVCKAHSDPAEQPGKNLTHRMVHKQLEVRVKQELSLIGRSLEDAAEAGRLKQTQEELTRQLRGCDATSEYVDSYRSRQAIRLPPVLSPERPSVEAVHPAVLVADGTLRNHAPGNVVISSVAVNIMKYRHMLGAIVALRDFCKRNKTLDRKLGESAAADLLIERLYEQHIIGVKQAFATKARLAQKVSANSWQATRQEWVSGKLSTGDTMQQKDWKKKFSNRATPKEFASLECGWTLAEQRTIRRIIVEIALKFNVVLSERPKGKDGLSWFGIRAAMPADWSMEKLYQLASFREMRWRLVCNRHAITVESKMGIALEIYYQSWSTEEQYGDMLGLPLVLCLRHPLNLSIGHLVHGRSMVSGWPLAPEQLSDRIGSLCNVSIETMATNMLRFDWDERRYKAVLPKLLEAFDPPIEFHNPSLRAPTAKTISVTGNIDTDASVPVPDEPVPTEYLENMKNAGILAEEEDAAAEKEAGEHVEDESDEEVVKKAQPTGTSKKAKVPDTQTSTTKASETTTAARKQSTKVISASDTGATTATIIQLPMSHREYTMIPRALRDRIDPRSRQGMVLRYNPKGCLVRDGYFATSESCPMFGWQVYCYDGPNGAEFFGTAMSDGTFRQVLSRLPDEVLATWNEKGEVFIEKTKELLGRVLGPDDWVRASQAEQSQDLAVQTPADVTLAGSETIEAAKVTTLTDRAIWHVRVDNEVDHRHILYPSMVISGSFGNTRHGFATLAGTYVTNTGEIIATFDDYGTVKSLAGNIIGQAWREGMQD